MALRRSSAAVAALAVLTLAGCSSGGGQAAAPAGDAPLEVVTSTNVYGSIAQAIGGDRVHVTALISDPAADPHAYESTPADAARVAGARIVVFNGGGYDDFMPRLVEAGGGDPTLVDVSEISGLVPPGDETGEGDGHDHASFNEHFWYSLPTIQTVATRLAADLGAADPAGAATYTSNAQAFNGSIGELLTRAQAIGAAHPGTRVAVTEPVPDYLIQSAGLTDVTPQAFTEAIEEDTDPPAAVLQQTLALFQGADPVRALVLNDQTETPTTDQVQQAAQTAGVPVVDVSETLPAGTTDYVSWMGGQIDALAGALNGS
jgi:zinc/manganese transport system substrate-binding protein